MSDQLKLPYLHHCAWSSSCLVNVRYTYPVCRINNCIRNLYSWFFANSHNLLKLCHWFHSSLFKLLKTWGTVFFRIVPALQFLLGSASFVFLISKIWFWSMVLSDSRSSILLLYIFSSVANCNSTCFLNFSNKFPYIFSNFLTRLQNCFSM